MSVMRGKPMRNRSYLLGLGTVLVLSSAGVLASPFAWYSGPEAEPRPAAVAQDSDDSSDLAERDEIRRTVQLQPGSRVEVSGINGAVTVTTAAGSAAEIYVVRSAKSRADLEHRRVLVEATESSLVIKGDNERGGRNRPEVRQRVVLKLPRHVDLSIRGVNGRVGVGEIDGTIHLSGINGRVDVAHARSTSEISGINGRVTISLVRLEESGLSISGVNGRVELLFSESVDADLSVTGINGHVTSEIGNITLLGKMTPSSFRGKIGAGGAPITVSGVNGNVRLLRAGTALE